MRTLTPEKKPKEAPPKNTNKPNQSNKLKKVLKTTFHDPFRYHMQTLPYEESQQVQQILLQYCTKMRNQGNFKQKICKEQFIRFTQEKQRNSKNLPPIIDKQTCLGINENNKNIIRQKMPNLLVIFYEEKKHTILQQLLCRMLYNKIPYVLIRQKTKICEAFGMKNLSVLGIYSQDHALYPYLFKYCSKCHLEIPWVLDSQWIGLKAQKPINDKLV